MGSYFFVVLVTYKLSGNEFSRETNGLSVNFFLCLNLRDDARRLGILNI